MIRTSHEMTPNHRENMRGGDGTVTILPLLTPEDYRGGTRMFSLVTLPVGASVGYHVHTGEEEYYYILAGTAEYNDNGRISRISAGDATVATTGEGHAIRNAGEVPLELLAVIVPVTAEAL